MVDINVPADLSVYLGVAGLRRLAVAICLHRVLAFGTSGSSCMHARRMIFYCVLCTN